MNGSITVFLLGVTLETKTVLGLFVLGGGDPGRRRPMRNRDTLKG